MTIFNTKAQKSSEFSLMFQFRVGYQLNDETIIFHTSCNKAQNLRVSDFHENLQESMVEIAQLFE